MKTDGGVELVVGEGRAAAKAVREFVAPRLHGGGGFWGVVTGPGRLGWSGTAVPERWCSWWGWEPRPPVHAATRGAGRVLGAGHGDRVGVVGG